MRALTILAALFAAAGLSVPAAATPSDMISVEDTLFGVDAQNIYVLRTMSDNMGSYYAERREVWLVEIDPYTGKETIWPVYGVARTTEFGTNGDHDRAVITPDDNPDRVDPYAVLAARGGMPLHERLPSDELPQPKVIEDNVIDFGYSEDSRYSMARAAMEGRYLSSIAALAGRVVDAPRLSSITTRQLHKERVYPASSCKPEPFGWPVRLTGGKTPFHPVRIICGHPDDGEYDALIQFAPLASTAEQ